MTLFPIHLKLNGKQTAIADLLRNCKKQAEWEKTWFDFLKEWYNETDFIEVNTSGSTGKPKTIRLKKSFIAASAQRTINFFKLKENDRVLHCLPAKYIAGKLMIVRALIGNLDLHVVNPSSNFHFLKLEHFKFAAMVSNQVIKILDHGIENLESLLIGGSAVPDSLIDRLRDIPTECYSSYAMTETATHIALQKLNGDHPDEFYHCLEQIQVQLSSENCLQIYMPGLQQPLRTTDLAELKDEKTFRILGRADHVIISGGIKFSPEQLEKKLDPFISQLFYFSSAPHETLGQQLVLIIEGDRSPALLFEIRTLCKQQLSRYEQPKQIRFVQQLPRTPNGKLNRKVSPQN